MFANFPHLLSCSTQLSVKSTVTFKLGNEYLVKPDRLGKGSPDMVIIRIIEIINEKCSQTVTNENCRNKTLGYLLSVLDLYSFKKNLNTDKKCL